MLKVSSFILIIVLYSCSIQHAINPEHYNYTKAKNMLTTDLALIANIEHLTLMRLSLDQISPKRAENIDKFIKECNFKLDLSKKLLEAGNYDTSYKISFTEYKKLKQILKSLNGDYK